MRTIFYMVLALLVLRMFFPSLASEIEHTLLAFLGFASETLAHPPLT